MIGHGIYPDLSPNPATGSRRIVTDLLRNEMGFEGITITDSMTMAAAAANLPADENLYIRALSAGVDLILMAGNPLSTKARIAAALESGKLSVDERRASVARVLAFRAAQARNAASLKQYKPGSAQLLQAAQWFAYELKA
jgi:beta-N-acetylhexosaminidase